MAIRSAEQPHIRFASELTVPPADRQRKCHSFYPKVAQEKGRSERRSSFDLFWQWGRLSSVPHYKSERWQRRPKHSEAEAMIKKGAQGALYTVSAGIPQHPLAFTGSGFDAVRGHLQATLTRDLPITIVRHS